MSCCKESISAQKFVQNDLIVIQSAFLRLVMISFLRFLMCVVKISFNLTSDYV